MTASQWRLIEEVFLVAADKEGEDRARYVDDACAGNEELKREVRSLLAHERIGAAALKGAVREAAHNLTLPPDKYLGSRIGPYSIVRQLGKGGMALVYLAVRSDEHYFQIVAIKLVRSFELINRFRAERQILANLTHPNIAAILDGGSTEDGTPYLVMEFVEGESIVDYAQSHALSTRERIVLFRSVCLAVHYAHQKLVIHRDIKPSNIMVTPDGTPKLLDFGIAKLLTPELLPSQETLTLAGNRVMTPAYASPEQVRGEYLTTATDVYSLGVVLFELLLGSPPYSTKSLSLRALERVICHQDVPKPSELPDVPPRIAKELRGDLENVILMALRKEPSRRYQSAEQMAEDLSRYLQGGPVIARRDTTAYRACKFLQRNKILVGTLAVLFLVLVAGIVATAWQARQTTRRLTELRGLADAVIFKVDDQLGNLPQSTAVRAVLIQGTLEYLDNLAKDPNTDPKLLAEISLAYGKIGEVQGAPQVANLGYRAKGLESIEKGLRIARRLEQRAKDDPTTTKLLIKMLHAEDRMRDFAGDTIGARAISEEALNRARAFQAEGPDDDDRKQILASSYLDFGNIQSALGRPNEAIANYREALKAAGGIRGKTAETDRFQGKVYYQLGGALKRTGPLYAALDAFRRVEEIRESLVRETPAVQQYQRELFVIDLALGDILGGSEYASMRDLAGASQYFEKAREIAERLAHLDSSNAQALGDLSLAYAGMGEGQSSLHPDAAASWFRKSIAISGEILTRAPEDTYFGRHLAIRRRQLATALAAAGRLHEAVLEAKTARGMLTNLMEHEPAAREIRVQLLASHCVLCDLDRQSGDATAATADKQAAVDLLRSISQTEPDSLLEYSLAKCYDAFARADLEHSQQWHQSADELRAKLHETLFPNLRQK